MNTPIFRTILVTAGVVLSVAGAAAEARAQQVECSSAGGKVAAVTNPAGHIITTRYQSPTPPNLQLLLTTTIESGEGCLIAHLSGQVRITDNAGSCIDQANPPTATHLVLTLEYR